MTLAVGKVDRIGEQRRRDERRPDGAPASEGREQHSDEEATDDQQSFLLRGDRCRREDRVDRKQPPLACLQPDDDRDPRERVEEIERPVGLSTEHASVELGDHSGESDEPPGKPGRYDAAEQKRRRQHEAREQKPVLHAEFKFVGRSHAAEVDRLERRHQQRVARRVQARELVAVDRAEEIDQLRFRHPELERVAATHRRRARHPKQGNQNRNRAERGDRSHEVPDGEPRPRPRAPGKRRATEHRGRHPGDHDDRDKDQDRQGRQPGAGDQREGGKKRDRADPEHQRKAETVDQLEPGPPAAKYLANNASPATRNSTLSTRRPLSVRPITGPSPSRSRPLGCPSKAMSCDDPTGRCRQPKQITKRASAGSTGHDWSSR